MDENSISKLFEKTVLDIKTTMVDDKNKSLRHHSPIDIAIEFRSISIKGRNFIVARKKKQIEISIQLKTRINPEDAQKLIK
ncbi:hypothetical protein [Flagellimonas sp. S3867]|uniref:hypothetical protein n=1 Tax=Flagellimonas sp. S3867 TaxID=2768063 RepID=UPI001684C643|nr:hypothetical protein [Flagellimonas sp. S3867]